jgi:hypothetical protein
LIIRLVELFCIQDFIETLRTLTNYQMKKKVLLTAMIAVATALVFTGCKKDEEEPAVDDHHTGTGTARINFVQMFGDSILDLGTEAYPTANNDTVTVDIFKYYVTNIKLTDDGGNVYSVPDSYYLINAANSASQTVTLSGIPSAHYTNLTFLLGVDSARNVSGAQTGALDPANGMFWTWSTGYIMAKMEGTSPQSTASMNGVTFHLGGFTGANSALRWISIPLTTHLSVTSTGNPLVTVKADASEWFKTPTTLNLATTNNVTMPGMMANTIINNYSDMFTLISVQN